MLVSFREAKAAFFDRQSVLSAADKAKIQALSKFGAFVRSDAQRSIRKRKKASSPGTPPTNRTGILKKFIFFSYDLTQESVVIGPVRLNGRESPDTLQALEYGGRFTRYRGRRASGGGKRQRVPYAASYPARPFMQPALAKNHTKLTGMWRAAIG